MRIESQLPLGERHGNLALFRPTYGSSDTAGHTADQAVDGDDGTYWQPSRKDRMEHREVWLLVDLGAETAVNRFVLRLGSGFVSGYALYAVTADGEWMQAYRKEAAGGSITALEHGVFPRVASRYFILEVRLFDPERDFRLAGLELYHESALPSGPVLDRLEWVEREGSESASPLEGDTVALRAGTSKKLAVIGRMTDGSAAELEPGSVRVTSSAPEVADLPAAGEGVVVRAVQPGIARLDAEAAWHGFVCRASLTVDVCDPAVWLADLRLEHPRLETRLGRPAFLSMGDFLPTLQVEPHRSVTASIVLVNATTGERRPVGNAIALQAGQAHAVALPGTVSAAGSYEVQVELQTEDGIWEAALHFFVPDPLVPAEGQSQWARLGEDGRLSYVPDGKGNRLADFSTCGYGGGGVPLPDVPAALRLEPGDGDQTARLQDAIDRVSALPLSAAGFRGAVVLAAGTYRLGGTLRLRAGGVVLRGAGSGPAGTVLLGTGRERRPLVEAAGAGPPALLEATRTPVRALYVPSGSRTLRVADASAFAVGDPVQVVRHGNARWIHAIGMDAIRARPVGGGTVPWPPFEMSFDRVITGIEGPQLTLDAPITHAIELRWGGGSVVKLRDDGRIEQVGVEGVRFESEYDPAVRDSGIDGNEGSEWYASDEQHAESAIVLDHVKHAWVRDVTARHMVHALVVIGSGAKWVTVRDCEARDFVSVITGGRRYAYHLQGQLSLVTRCRADQARHAFVVDARVAGPNVFLDCVSSRDYNSSEPHHRWSVGCLYDNVAGRLHIQDRGWLGSGHGWSGANYAAWNTRGELVCQQPPTAVNYAIGHVGLRGTPFLPNAYDPRPREEGFWDRYGEPVEPRSLYLQQVHDRLGPPSGTGL